MEENPVRRYEEGDIPYYEYSSASQPKRPTIPTSMPPQPPLPPGRPRKRGLLLMLAVGSVILACVLIFLSGLPQALFHQAKSTQTPVVALPTHVPTAQPTLTTNFHPSSCPFPLGSGMVDGRTVNCGYVTVPESRSNPTGATVKLAVAIFKSPNVQNDPYPVIRLEGGPGGPSLDNWARYVTSANFSTFVSKHDLIMFDQRGTGYSTPSLACPETQKLQFDILNEHLNAADSERLYLQALGACNDRLVKSGIDLNAFTSIENAADVHDVILALGYKQANLYGVSYGTRLALTTMRLYPAVIRSVVLDSTYPPQRNRTDLPGTAQRDFNVLFQGCAANVHCAKSYPHLETDFYQLITELNATPVHFQTTDLIPNKSYNVLMAGNDFVFVLFSALYVTQFIPALPRMIAQVRDHNYPLLSQIYGEVEFNDYFSDGMFYSAECSEDWDFLTQNDIAISLQGIAPQILPALQTDLQQEHDACQLWHVQQAPTVQKQPVVSAIPTLVLSDEYDPITPPAHGKLAAQTLTNSYYFLFPGLGHGAEYNSPCADSIIAAFYDNPTQKPSEKRRAHSSSGLLPAL